MARSGKDGQPIPTVLVLSSLAFALSACASVLAVEPTKAPFVYPCQQGLFPEDTSTIMPHTFLVSKPTDGNFCDFIVQQHPDGIVVDVGEKVLQLLVKNRLYPDHNLYSGSLMSLPLPSNPDQLSWMYFSTQVEDHGDYYEFTTNPQDFILPTEPSPLPGLPVADIH